MFKNLSPEALGFSGRESEIIELVLSHGFKGLDLDLVDFAEQVKSQGYDRAARLITSARLKIGSFRLPVDWTGDDTQYKADLEKLPGLAELAQKLGCTRATTLIEPGSDTRPYHENFEFHRRRLNELAAALKPYKIRLGAAFLAPIACRANYAFQFMQTADEAVLLLRTIGSPDIGLAFDAWHWHVGKGTIEQLRGLSAGQIVTVSLADVEPNATAADANLGARRLPGENPVIDMPAILRVLAEVKYDGPVTLAPHPSQLAGLGRDKAAKAVGAALDSVWKAAGLNAAGKLAAVPKP